MTRKNSKQKRTGCCSFNFPDIPAPWLLFIEFAFTFGTTIVYFADIVTDIITLKMYFDREWYYAFGFSVFFIVMPSILLAVLEFNFLRKTYGKSVPWKTIGIRTALNVPFQLTVVWYHCQLTYTFFKNWLDHLRGIERENATTTAQWYDPTTLERSRGASLSSLNELDFHHRAPTEDSSEMHGSRGLVGGELSLSMGSLAGIDGEAAVREKTTWWKRLTREQWLSHLNKLKLSESMLESLPQLLINLYLIIYYPDTAVIQYISAVLSYLSLCGGVVRYDKTRKDNEADRWMVDRTLLHSRAFYTRLEWPQLLFISLYKGSFIAARILSFVFFTIYFSWYILIPILIHWGVFLCYLVYRWYPDFSKVTRQLRQADYKYRAYIFLSHDFMSVFHASLMGIFIHVRPYYHAFLDQPYCFMFWYYVVYVTENIFLFLMPGIIKSLQGNEDHLNYYQYYILLPTGLVLNLMGCILCSTYYIAVHKLRAYTAHAYPFAARVLCCCCYGNDEQRGQVDQWLPINSEWTVCKQAETSEIFFLTKEQLKTFQKTYNTVVRNDRHKGRTIECFIDDRCKIFYAPRSKMKKLSVKTHDDDATLRPFLRKLNDSSTRPEAIREFAEDDAFLEERMMLDSRGDEDVTRDDSINGSVTSSNHSNNHVTVEDSRSENVEPKKLKSNDNQSCMNTGENPATVSANVETHSPATADAERPVRKPRVYSLRQTNKTNDIPLRGDPDSRERPVTKVTPTRPPRSSDSPAWRPEIQSEPDQSSSARSSSRRSGTSSDNRSSKSSRWLEELEPERRKPLQYERTPRRIDDTAWSPQTRPKSQPKIIDDSTYRISKKSDSASKKFKPRVGFETTVDLDRREEEDAAPQRLRKQAPPEDDSGHKYHKTGEVIDADHGWQQTWI